MSRIKKGFGLRLLAALAAAALVASCGGGADPSSQIATAEVAGEPQAQILAVAAAPADCGARNGAGLTPLYLSKPDSKGVHRLGGKVVPALPQSECSRDLSLAGKDSNGDAVRDDIERYIAANYGGLPSPVAYNAARRYAVYLQSAMLTRHGNLSMPFGKRLGRRVQEILLNLWACQKYDEIIPASLPEKDRSDLFKALSDVRKWMGDTPTIHGDLNLGRRDEFAALDDEIKAFGNNLNIDIDQWSQGCRLALREVAPAVAQDGRSNVLYINGIKTGIEGAMAGVFALKNAIEAPPAPRIKRTARTPKLPGVRMYVFHNPTDWALAGDIREVAQTKKNEENYIAAYRKTIRPDALDPPKLALEAKSLLGYLGNENQRISSSQQVLYQTE